MVTLYCSGELDSNAMAEFERHTQSCAVCTHELEMVSSYDAILKDAFLSQELRSDELRNRVLEQIRSTGPRIRRRYFTPVRMFAAAAMVIISLSVVGVYRRWRQALAPTTYSAALEDHLDEIVLGQPRRWRERPDEINAFLKSRMQDVSLIDKLCPANYRLQRVKVCDLAGEVYLHLVYSNGDRSVSIFAKSVEGEQAESRSALAIEEHSTGELRVDGCQTPRIKFLVVSDLPRQENYRLAYDAARRVV